jgi:septal ring factor EnvC (AmiA/AmiB activator)
MFIDILAELEVKIKKTNALNAKDQAELLELLTELKSEIARLSQTHEEHATSIEGFTRLSTHEATRQDQNQHLLSIALDGLSKSVEGFEVSHPELVNTVNKISTILSNMGI